MVAQPHRSTAGSKIGTASISLWGMSVAAPFGSHGQVVLVTEAGNLWKNAGSTYTGELEGMPRLGPSKRCLNAVEALFMVQKGALLLQRGLACDVPEEIMAFHEAIEFLMPFVNVKAFETYMALKDKGFVVRFPSPDDFTVVHVYYMASTFKFSKPREPDAIVRIHGYEIRCCSLLYMKGRDFVCFQSM